MKMELESSKNSDLEDALWHLTAIRIQGLRLMRPEKSWRPIVTVEVDKHHSYEFFMGCDGQNPNHKDIFRFHNASTTSVLQVKIWRQSQTKKKGKRRNLVATAAHSLGELLKRQELERKLGIRLQCQTPSKRVLTSSKGKPQNGALLYLQLCPPHSTLNFTDEPALDLDSDNDSGQAIPDAGYVTDPSSSSDSSDTNGPPSPSSQVAQSGLRRRRIRGYTMFSDEEPFSEEYTSDEAGEPPLVNICNNTDPFTLDDSFDHESSKPRSEILAICRREIHLSDGQWFAASDLPQYTVEVEEVKIPPSLSFAEQIVASFTVYLEMKDAVLDSHYEKVFHRLQHEWTYVGGLLVALAALNTGAFSLSNNSIFRIDPWCRSAVATSSIATGLGIACDTWFLFRYNWADLQTFIRRAKDVFDSYFFFSLTSRVPALCMLISGISLMLFLGLVAYEAWPEAVLVISFLIGLIMSLQFLVFTAHWCAISVVYSSRLFVKRIRGV